MHLVFPTPRPVTPAKPLLTTTPHTHTGYLDMDIESVIFDGIWVSALLVEMFILNIILLVKSSRRESDETQQINTKKVPIIELDILKSDDNTKKSVTVKQNVRNGSVNELGILPSIADSFYNKRPIDVDVFERYLSPRGWTLQGNHWTPSATKLFDNRLAK